MSLEGMICDKIIGNDPFPQLPVLQSCQSVCVSWTEATRQDLSTEISR